MVSFRLKFMLIIVNICLCALLFSYVTPSLLVLLALVPALVYGVYTHRFFLILMAVLMFTTISGLFACLILFPEAMGEIAEGINLIAFLYRQIFPYQMQINLFALMSAEIIYGITIFLFFDLITAWMLKIDTFKMMIAFSYFIMIFTSLYLILNVFLYLFAPLRVLVLESVWLQCMLFSFYVVLPFIVLVLIFLFLETFFSREERRKYHKDVKVMDKGLNRRHIKQLMKYLTVFFMIVFILVLLTLLVIV